ncbi:MAG: RNA-binding S4 domain-containing protein [Firmicutes bacterium]|nr:RNA-binding S4 domain-containing protein [Bacillota bacterium]
MRVDKYLKVSRLVKRRTDAKELCDAGRVQINGRPAKAGTEVQVGDKLSFTFGPRYLEVEVLIVAENVRAGDAATMYNVLKEERIKEEFPLD